MTRSPSASWTMAAYSANRSAVSRTGQPPRVLQRLGQVPVVERGPGLDAVLQERVDQAAVEVEAALVDRPGAGRLDPRPGDGEAVGAQAEVGHQRDVVAVAVVVVGGDGAGVAVVGWRRGWPRRCPRWTARGRPRRPRPRSGSSRSRRPTGSRDRTCSSLDRSFHDAADDLPAERDEDEAAAARWRPACRRTSACSRCSTCVDSWLSENCTVGLSASRTASGQRNSFQVPMKVNSPSTAAPGRSAGSTTVQKIPEGGAAVDAGRFDELVRYGAFGVLAHQEDAERGDQERHDDGLQRFCQPSSTMIM